MASKFQNRLVGTVILVALVVIFLPDLMDGNKIDKTYNNYTDNWFVVKLGDNTPYGPEFMGNIDKTHFDI